MIDFVYQIFKRVNQPSDNGTLELESQEPK